MNKKNGFKSGIKYEISQQPIADNYYLRLYGNHNELIRYDYGDEKGKIMQNKGVDCTILDKNLNPPKYVNYQEKFRRSDYGDMMIELYSDYPRRLGWGITDKADRYSYFIDPEFFRRKNSDPRDISYGKVYELDAEIVYKIATWALEKFNKADWKDDWLNSSVLRKDVFPAINNEPIIRYVKTYSEDEDTGAVWMSIAVCIRWTDIKTYFGKVKENITIDLNHL